ncbi:MAG: hypothetical protein KQI62_18985 [Deltaproteobacteria bacterium]|nr:hypothetical protein [Deltaproteobacteria bacterium]
MRRAAVMVLWLLGLELTAGCLGKAVTRPPGRGPFLASDPCLPSQGDPGWLWGLTGGVALGLVLALGLRWWRLLRARRAGAGQTILGSLESLQGALALVEQVFTGCQRRMKVVDFDDWVARRRKKMQGRHGEPPEL